MKVGNVVYCSEEKRKLSDCCYTSEVWCFSPLFLSNAKKNLFSISSRSDFTFNLEWYFVLKLKWFIAHTPSFSSSNYFYISTFSTQDWDKKEPELAPYTNEDWNLRSRFSIHICFWWVKKKGISSNLQRYITQIIIFSNPNFRRISFYAENVFYGMWYSVRILVNC